MSSQPAPAARRLNPFILPSDTDFRFVLLIVAIVAASITAFNSLQVDVSSTLWTRITADCIQRSIQAYPNDLSLQIQYEKQCRDSYEFLQAGVILGGVLILFLTAGVIYWLIPKWLIWRRRLSPFTAEDDTQIMSSLNELCRESALARPPVFLSDPFNANIGGLAFGRMGRRYVALNGGLLAEFHGNPARFRAIVRHELAHLKNNDVDKTYFAVSASLAFGLVALIPLGISLIDDVFFGTDFIFGLNLAWRAIVIAGYVYLALAALLRTREIHADIRASIWDGEAGALREMLSKPSGGNRLSFLGFHPDSRHRLRSFDEPQRLFRLPFWDAFAAGIASTLAFPDLNALFGLLLDSQYEILTPYGASILFAPMMAGVMALGAWRNIYAARAQNAKPQGAGRLGAAFGLGMILGLWLALRSAVPYLDYGSFAEWLVPSLFLFFWGSLLVVGLFFLSKWMTAGAAVWLETARSAKSLMRAYIFSILPLTAIMTLCVGFWYFFWFQRFEGVYTIIRLSGGVVSMMDHVIGSSYAFWVFLSLWAYPLSARFFRRNEIVIENARLEKDPPPLRLKSLEPTRAGLAILIGVVNAVLALALMTIIRLGARFTLAEAAYTDMAWKDGYLKSQIALAILFELGAAFTASIWIKRLGWAHGLFAAFVAGGLITLGFVGLVEIGDCWSIFSLGGVGGVCANVFDPILVGFLGGYMVNWGAFLSIPVAVAVSKAASWFRR
ncbi:MAG: Protease HtpX [Anaerolineales bacterium]|nr:Protease HtpX [Anaerolineales bacterium]